MRLEFPLPEFRIPVRVYIEDTDGGGIVYYVNYLKFMERARTELLRDLGFAHYLTSDEDVMFVVRGADVRYFQPARMDDALTVTAQVRSLGRASLVFSQEVRRGDVTLATGTIDIACVKRSDLKPRALPEHLKSLLQRRYGQAGTA
ncbi:MAG: tol-pal system-associated acyl-CoA thioesterase [Pseudomonadota bacterium]